MELGGPGSQYLSLGLIHNLFTGLSAPTPIVPSPHSSLKDPFNVSHRSELSYGSWTQSVKSKVLVVACEAPRLPFLAPVTALISFSFPFPSHSLHGSHTGFCVARWISRHCLRAFALLPLSPSDGKLSPQFQVFAQVSSSRWAYLDDQCDLSSGPAVTSTPNASYSALIFPL